jgi:aspartyl protease family protein
MIRNITLISILLAGLLYLLNKNFPGALSDRDNILHILQSVLVLSIIALGVSRKNFDAGFLLKGTMVWLSIALVIVSGYSYRFQLTNYYQTILGNIIPSMGTQGEEGEVAFRAGSNGHFTIQSKVNGQKVTFLLDTGATRVALTAQDAKRAGFSIDRLNYDQSVSTANGTSYFAIVTIGEIRIGDITINNVPAFVAKSGLDSSLLGMSFLSRLKEYEVKQDTLTFRK